MNYYLLSKWIMIKRMILCALFGILFGAAMGYAIVSYAVTDDDVNTGEHQGLISACKLPTTQGAMTVFIHEDGKIKCWRWK